MVTLDMDFTLCLVLLSLLPAALAQSHDEGKFSFDVDLFTWYFVVAVYRRKRFP